MRSEIEALILEVLDLLDPSKENSSRYATMFKSMNDADFDTWMNRLANKEEKLHVFFPNMMTPLKMPNIIAAADHINVPLFSRIKMYDESTQREYTTPEEYAVILGPVRRLQQHVQSKMSIPEGDTHIDQLTGQVTKPDKGSGMSVPEMLILMSKGLPASLVELTNVRGGNVISYSSLKSMLEENGSASLSEIGVGSTKPRSAVTLGILLKGMGIDNNIVEGV